MATRDGRGRERNISRNLRRTIRTEEKNYITSYAVTPNVTNVSAVCPVNFNFSVLSGFLYHFCSLVSLMIF